MKLLRALLNEETGTEEPTNRLTQDQMDTIQKNIREGTKADKETGQYQKWANALHLVHKAYEVANIQRPTPDMKELWKQYEENIEYAVKELSKAHGIDGAWRMTAADLHKGN